jgi:hypothetical protein
MCYRHLMLAMDTSADAAEVQEQAYHELGMGGRLRIALELSDLTHALAVAGIRRRRPLCTDEDARRQLGAALYQSSGSQDAQ